MIRLCEDGKRTVRLLARKKDFRLDPKVVISQNGLTRAKYEDVVDYLVQRGALRIEPDRIHDMP